MKFKFCSEGDCPLWALAALHALSSLPTQVFKALVEHIVEGQPEDGVIHILKDTQLCSREECARAAAVIRWVLQQCWRCSCSSALLTRDLLVLGVPRAHAAALADAADAGREGHALRSQAKGFAINKLTDVSISPGPGEDVSLVKLTMVTEQIFTAQQEKRELLIEKSKVKNLLSELKRAYEKMEQIDGQV